MAAAAELTLPSKTNYLFRRKIAEKSARRTAAARGAVAYERQSAIVPAHGQLTGASAVNHCRGTVTTMLQASRSAAQMFVSIKSPQRSTDHRPPPQRPDGAG